MAENHNNNLTEWVVFFLTRTVFFLMLAVLLLGIIRMAERQQQLQDIKNLKNKVE